MEKGLVSLICPCYNSELYIERFLKSILNQTYTNVQIIIVDDGSTDKTYDIINKHKNEFTMFNEFLVLNKQNGGAASAVDMALKYVRGEFICWADSDDLLEPDNIKEKVKFLNENKDYALACCDAVAVDFDTNNTIRPLKAEFLEKSDNAFYVLIYPGVHCYPGVFIIRSEVLFSVIKDKTIPYNKEVGQNWQLLLPCAYKNKCGYIKEPLYKYYIRSNSHSRSSNYERDLNRIGCQCKILKEIMAFSNDKKVFRYIDKVNYFKLLNIYLKNNKTNEYIDTYHMYFKDFMSIDKYLVKYFFVRFPFLSRMYKKIMG